MKKKIVSIFLATSMALSLCACGDAAGNTAAPAEGNTSLRRCETMTVKRTFLII